MGKGLRTIISENPDFKVVGEAANGIEVLEKIRKEPCDVIVLDLSMPGVSGLEVLNQIKKWNPRQKVLILSMHSEDQYGVRVLKAGASGYLNKESAPEALVDAIRQLARGRKYITPSLAERLADALSPNNGNPAHEALSDREFEVMCLLANGMTVREAGQKLFLSEKTVGTYRARLMEKMNLTSTAGIIRYALKNNLLD